jgi:hypothetical protein
MKNTLRNKVIEKLKEDWYSNFGINVACKSGSADRIMRFIRENPPEGYFIDQRKKEQPKKYNPCLEYKLCEVLQ